MTTTTTARAIICRTTIDRSLVSSLRREIAFLSAHAVIVGALASA